MHVQITLALGAVTYFDRVSHKLRDYNLLLDCLHNQLVNRPTDIKRDRNKKIWFAVCEQEHCTEVTYRG